MVGWLSLAGGSVGAALSPLASLVSGPLPRIVPRYRALPVQLLTTRSRLYLRGAGAVPDMDGWARGPTSDFLKDWEERDGDQGFEPRFTAHPIEWAE